MTAQLPEFLQQSFAYDTFATLKRVTRRERFTGDMVPTHARGGPVARQNTGASRVRRPYFLKRSLEQAGEVVQDAIDDGQAIGGFMSIVLSLGAVPDVPTLPKFRGLPGELKLTRAYQWASPRTSLCADCCGAGA